MKLPFRRRRRSAPAQALHLLLTVLGVRARLRLARGAARTALRGGRAGLKGVRVARAVPWRALGFAGAAAVLALVARRLTAGGGAAPAVTPAAPAPAPGPAATAELPTEPALDLDGPNESAPGHHPTDAERQAAS
jgi:hypothetical protein